MNNILNFSTNWNNKLDCIMIGNAVPPLLARRVFAPHIIPTRYRTL